MKFILNKNDEILQEIKSLILQSKKIDLAVAYITLGGWQLIVKELINNNLTNKLRLITTLDELITDPSILKKLIQENSQVKIINKKKYKNNDRGFHMKTIIFYLNTDEVIVMNGSLNLTREALKSKFEYVSFSEINSKQVIESFNYLWEEASIVPTVLIEEYEREFNQKDNLLFLPNLNSEFIVRPVQQDGLNKLQLAREEKINSVILIAPTGIGKTFISALDTINLKAKRILFLAHRTFLINNARNAFEYLYRIKERDNFNKIKFVYNQIDILTNYKQERYCHFLTNIKLFNYLNKFPNDYYDYIIIDEAHRLEVSTYKTILNYLKPKFILGITATPIRTDAKDVRALFEKDYLLIELEEAIKRNYLAPFNYFGIEDYDNSFKVDTINRIKQINNEIIKYGYYGDKIRAIIFVETQFIANQLEIEFNKLEVNQARAIISDNLITNEQIELIFNKIDNPNDNLKYLISVDKLSEGIDIPKLNLVIMQRKTKSRIVWLQQIGRGLRKYGSKSLTILDFVGNDDENNYLRFIDIDKETNSIRELVTDFIAKNYNKQFENSYFQLTKKANENILISLRQAIIRRSLNPDLNLYRSISKLKQKIEYKTIYNSDLRKIRDLVLKYGSISYFLKQNLNKTHEDELIKLIQYMPIIASTPKEKEIIIKLYLGEKVHFDDKKWIWYFTNYYAYGGKNYFLKINKNPFIIDNGEIYLKRNELSENIVFHLDQTIIYLKNLTNDYLVKYYEYDSAAIIFMLRSHHKLLSPRVGQFWIKEQNELIFLSNNESKREVGKNSYSKEKIKIFPTIQSNEFMDQILNKNLTLKMFFSSTYLSKSWSCFNKTRSIYFYLGDFKNETYSVKHDINKKTLELIVNNSTNDDFINFILSDSLEI